MKIVFVSDTHGCFPDIPECDICCFIGDYQMNDGIWENSDYFQDLKKRCITIGVAGNHDATLFYNEQLGHDMFTHYLLNTSVIVNGIKFFGTPHILLPNKPFSKTEEELEEIYKNADISNTDIFLAHQPCWGITDGLIDSGVMINVGSRVLRKYVDDIKPKVFACGHIHEGYGYVCNNVTHYINVAYCEKKYVPRWKVVMLDYDSLQFSLVNV